MQFCFCLASTPSKQENALNLPTSASLISVKAQALESEEECEDTEKGSDVLIHLWNLENLSDAE